MPKRKVLKADYEPLESEPKSKRLKKTPRTPKTISKLKAEADKYFSIATRYRFANDDGTAECVTCGVRKPVKQLQCGHFMSRRFSSTRFEERNTAPQCVACNMFRSGEQYKFSLFIEDYYGKGTAEELRSIAQRTHKFTREELEGIISDSKEQIKFFERV